MSVFGRIGLPVFRQNDIADRLTLGSIAGQDD